jgi:hypothetical protein
MAFSKSTFFHQPALTGFAIILFALLCVTDGKSQSLPDSVVLTRITYVNIYSNGDYKDSIYSKDNYVFRRMGDTYETADTAVDENVIMDFLREIKAPENFSNPLGRYGIDTVWIKTHPESVLKKTTDYKRYAWNSKQKELIIPELNKISNYKAGLSAVLNEGCCYTMHQWHRQQYVATIYDKDTVSNQITSRKFVYGHRYPWVTNKGDTLFTYKIGQIVDELIRTKVDEIAPLRGDKLLKKLADKIVARNSQSLDKLAPFSYQKEIDELSPTFNILDYSAMTGYGGYHGDPVIQILLHNSLMLPNVNIEFLVSKQKGSIYSRDSVIKDYKDIVSRVQSIKFIIDFLAANPHYYLNILYSDNKAINHYNTNIINTNPTEWAKYDKYEKMLEEIRKIIPDTSADRVRAKKISEHLDCGCNYRFDADFISKAISFNIDEADHGNHSRWVLLPDNRVLLYLSSGQEILNHHYTEFGDHPGMLYPCVMFDINGNILPKKTQ